MEKSKMTPHSLKVENCSSHCTTPSERIAPDLIPIKVGCFHINLASSRGRRIFLLQMLVLCFVPHAALIMQNCSIMAQLSQTLDSSVNLNAEVNTILSLSELVVSLEDERLLVTQCLFSDDTQVDKTTLGDMFSNTDALLGQMLPKLTLDDYKMTLYHFREDVVNIRNLKISDSFKRMAVYEDINSVFLMYITKHVKSTSSSLWRQLSACQELLKCSEQLSLAHTTLAYQIYAKGSSAETTAEFQSHFHSGHEFLVSAIQYLEAERLVDDVKNLETISVLYGDAKVAYNGSQSRMNVQHSVMQIRACLERLKEAHIRMWLYVRDSVRHEVWVARRTLAVGVTILVVVLLASPVLVLLLRYVVNTIKGNLGCITYIFIRILWFCYAFENFVIKLRGGDVSLPPLPQTATRHYAVQRAYKRHL